MNTPTDPTEPTDAYGSRAHHHTPDPNGPHSASQGPLRGARGAETDHHPDTPGATGLAGAELLDAVHAAVGRYVVLPSPAAAVAVVLWAAATHAQPAWAHAPRLVIRAPEKRCGKSRLLDIIEALCWAPFITVNSSPAAVYRSIDADPPTLLVDEADTIFGPKDFDAAGVALAGR